MEEDFSSPLKDIFRDKIVECTEEVINRVGDIFFYEVLPSVWHKHVVPFFSEAKDILFSKELKIDQIQREAELKAIKTETVSSKAMTKEEAEIEKRKLLYHWIGILNSLTRLHNAGELDMESTLKKLTNPKMIESVNVLLSENPNLLETNKYILLHSLLGRDLYMEGQFIPIKATEIVMLAKNNGGIQ